MDILVQMRRSHYDTSLRAIFGSGVQSTEENVVQALKAYIEDLQARTNGLLLQYIMP